MLSYRFTATDRARRQVRQAFSYYLPEAEVNRLLAQDQVPELGGEIREVTIYMSDVVGFTKLCEGQGPSETVQTMNAYFSVATEIIEAHHGCVYMYIGDAIVAIFGAPLEDEHHARHAVEAALVFRGRIDALGAELGLPGNSTLEVRTGIATGPALIGNIGSPRRLNYTAMGDTVNLASRLEGANKFYGTDILVDGSTATEMGGSIAALPVERVRVQGMTAPVDLYFPLGLQDQLDPAETEMLKRFQEVAKLRDRGAFTAARKVICGVGDGRMLEVLSAHLAEWETEPPPTGKLPVFDLPEK